MTGARWVRTAALALVVLAPTVIASGGSAAQEEVPSGVVYGAGASGAVIGLTLRIPAVSAGGVGYADSQVNLQSARARASVAYPGFLVDAFVKSSCGCAYNATDTIAQNPPSSSAPAAATFQGSQVTPAGELTTLVAETPSTVSATSRTVTGSLRAPGAPVSVDSGRVVTSSLVQPDGTVVTEATSTAEGITVADTVTISRAVSRARTTTAPGATPVREVTTTVGSVFVAGLRAELSQSGLVLADQSLVTPAQVATFNSSLQALEEQGVYVSALQPVVDTSRPGFSELLTGAVRIRYEVRENPTPNDIGTDTDLLLASVGNLSSSQNRTSSAPSGDTGPPDISLPTVPSELTGSPGAGTTVDAGMPSLDAAGAGGGVGPPDAAAPAVAPPEGAVDLESRPSSLSDLLANSRTGGPAPAMARLYGFLVLTALLFAFLPLRIAGRRGSTT